jgi:hypothetical protein
LLTSCNQSQINIVSVIPKEVNVIRSANKRQENISATGNSTKKANNLKATFVSSKPIARHPIRSIKEVHFGLILHLKNPSKQRPAIEHPQSPSKAKLNFIIKSKDYPTVNES